MSKYYFVGTMLPSLSFDISSELSFEELILLLQNNLTRRDYEKILTIRNFFDVLNLRSLWLEEELDSRGGMTALELEEALFNRVGLPDYIHEFIDRYSKKEERLRHFPFLLATFFQTTQHLKDLFLIRYLKFERELRLILTSFRAKKLGRSLNVELQYENLEEPLIAQLLAQQDSSEIELPENYQALKSLFEKNGDNPLSLQKSLDQYRVEFIESLVDMADTFSIERILAYFTQYVIIEKWFELDKAKGKEIIETIVKESHGNA